MAITWSTSNYNAIEVQEVNTIRWRNIPTSNTFTIYDWLQWQRYRISNRNNFQQFILRLPPFPFSEGIIEGSRGLKTHSYRQYYGQKQQRNQYFHHANTLKKPLNLIRIHEIFH